MPPKIKIADATDIIGFQPLLRETVKGLLFGSIEWKKSIGGIRSPSPEMAFHVNARRVQEEFDHEKNAWVDLLSPAPVQKSVADTDGLRRVIFSVETGSLWKSLQLSVGWADDTAWEYPEVMPEMGQAQFVDDDYSFPRETFLAKGPGPSSPSTLSFAGIKLDAPGRCPSDAGDRHPRFRMAQSVCRSIALDFPLRFSIS